MVVCFVLGVLMFMSKCVKDVVCPFYRPSRKFTVPFCDNLVSGVPSCLVDKFYPDLDIEEEVARYRAHVPDPVICVHFVRTDALYARFPLVKSACFFGGDKCFHPLVSNYSACRDCSRFR